MTLTEAIVSIDEGKFILVTQESYSGTVHLIIGRNGSGDLMQVNTEACRICGRPDKIVDIHYLQLYDGAKSRSYELITTEDYNTLINKYFK